MTLDSLDDADALAKYLPELKVGGGHPFMRDPVRS
jgi:hypothetical protein